MGLLAEYQISYQRLPLVDIATAVPETTLHLSVGRPNQAGPPPFIVRATGNAFEALEGEFETAEFVQEFSLVAQEDSIRQYRLLPAKGMIEQLAVDDPARLRTLATVQSIIERITVTPEGWIQQRWFADREEFTAYCAFWRETATSFSLHRLTEDDRAATPTRGLTDRQREALVTAHEKGYFEIPRTASLDEIAAELGISASSLSERLRRAQTHLVETHCHSAEVYKRPHS